MEFIEVNDVQEVILCPNKKKIRVENKKQGEKEYISSKGIRLHLYFSLWRYQRPYRESWDGGPEGTMFK